MKSGLARTEDRLASPGVGVAAVVVSAGSEGELAVQLDARVVTARRAASCLTSPEPGDEVLVVFDTSGRRFVIAVLTRAAAGPTVLAVDGDARFEATGHLEVVAREGATFVTPLAMQIVAGAIDVTAARARAAVEHATVLGRDVAAEIHRLKTVAVEVERVAERAVDRLKRSLRLVEEGEQVRAGRLDQIVGGLFRLRAKNAMVSAETLVKVDGEQIHLG